jgi:hypothetical protein
MYKGIIYACNGFSDQAAIFAKRFGQTFIPFIFEQNFTPKNNSYKFV